MPRTLYTISVLAALLLTACGSGSRQSSGSPSTSGAAVTAAPSSTPDACAADALADSMQPYLMVMQRFDDAAVLVANTPVDQLVEPIADLQAIRRDAQGLQPPDCLRDLKTVEIAYMNQVIEISLAFLSSGGQISPENLNASLQGSGQLRQIFDQEVARLLGITPEANTVATEPPAGEESNAASDATAEEHPQVVVISPDGANVRTGPGSDFPLTAALDTDSTATALGRSEDSQWLLIESSAFEGQGWVFAALVELSVPVDQLPVAPTSSP